MGKDADTVKEGNLWDYWHLDHTCCLSFTDVHHSHVTVTVTLEEQRQMFAGMGPKLATY